ncbi:tRNA glutamyl-Q(34) synthetase GluQRS [Yoonia sediminilitoris]|uniref:Glutamyl-Q tRNA(Asp) synthetase n=1 Tax=Yoonia sediminilitoris TaxID=1286148 RepID=A0A2T6KD23_9RHOB|nr:tRNA glutamyl-Q(34) synthetase GluQRS [Yoonia sediminilitoris]PUB12798.1 glutamyl-Q tRNA(Asp) synthetase [Yoonia sediminilitoris]RCW94277.1 glutamyl-Q tRNA(Asp) synthetase [Yoonia sediminilitoris]
MITRFAPSPTGPLHLGHAYSAMFAFDMAMAAGGTFLLRMDDIDRVRSKPEFEAQAIDDLHWLGLSWPEPVMHESQSTARFQAALKRLEALDLLYPCSCSRADIANAASAPQEGVPTHGPDGQIYPGTCRNRPMSSFRDGDAIRLNMRKAIAASPLLPCFVETGSSHAGTHQLVADDLLTTIGDVAVARKGMAAAYHLCVVVDDHAQAISHVIRGADLYDATRIHVLLFHLLRLPIPIYHHHRLIRDEAGKRLAKRDDARAIAKYRADGATPNDIRQMVGLPASSI